MAAEGSRHEAGHLTDKTKKGESGALNDDQMRDASIEAINRIDPKTGERSALPTPEFAVEEGGEILDVLKQEMLKMDPNQLGSLEKALFAFQAREGVTHSDDIELLSNKLMLIGLTATSIAVVIGFLTGDLQGAGIAGTTIASTFSVGGGYKIGQRIEEFDDRTEAVLDLLNQVKEQQEKQATE